jgi:hypothetical protein
MNFYQWFTALLVLAVGVGYALWHFGKVRR